MEQQCGDGVRIFPHQGPIDGYAFVFCESKQMGEPTFYVGEGNDGDVNRLYGDGLDLGDQFKLIHEFCKNPNLNHLKIKFFSMDFIRYEAMNKSLVFLLWATLMRELQTNASLEYIEVYNSLPSVQDDNSWMRPIVDLLNTNSTLLGFKIHIAESLNVDLIPLMMADSTNKSLQILHLNFYQFNPGFDTLKLLMASLTPNSSGYQSNTTLRVLFIDFVGDLEHREARALVEVFVNMLETNKTLTTIQIPSFVCSVYDINKVFYALKFNQSISNIFLCVRFDAKYYQERMQFHHYEYLNDEHSIQEVFSRLLELIKFRNFYGNSLNIVDVQGTIFEKSEFNVHIQGALKKKYCCGGSYDEFYIRPMSCRVFLCGFPKAGKTTLRKKMKYILHEKSKKFHPLYSLSKGVGFSSQHVSKRTVGVEVVSTHVGAIELSFWDMGGQDEYHAYHDLVIPNLSDNGSASLFILVCSMVIIKDGGRSTNAKSTRAIELELQYWLRFLSSNTRTSRNFKLHVLVVFTHVDILPKSMNVGQHVEDLLTSMKHKFGDFFHFSSMEYFVNSNSIQLVEPLVGFVAKEVEVVLSKVPNIFAACLQMKDEITNWKKNHPCRTIIKWRDFVQMCYKLTMFEKAIAHLDQDLAQDICKTIASSLNEGGYIMYFEGLDVIVVDPNWFGSKIIGSIFSIDHKCLDPHTKEPITNEKGYMERDRLASILENSFKDKKGAFKKGLYMAQHVEVDDLISVMKEMNVCFEEHSTQSIEKPKKSIFIPATLRDEGGLVHQGRRKLNWNVIGSSSSGPITYVGRRLQCEDLERTFLTPGFFPRLQVFLERKFGSKSTFRLEKNMVAFTKDGMQVLVEQSGDLASNNFVDGFIDIMVQSLKTSMKTLQFVKEDVTKPIQTLCASPTFGCQGVILSQSILRPMCVEHLWLCNDRRDQAINERVLIDNVLSKEDFEGYIHHWPDHYGDEARKLLGDAVWNEKIVNRRIANMAKLTFELMQEQDQDMVSVKKEEIGLEEEPLLFSLEGLYKKLTTYMDKKEDSTVERINKHTQETICSMRNEILEEVSKSMNRLIDHSMQLLQRQVPCYVYVTIEDLGTSEWLISSLVPGLKLVQLHLMCECKGDIHTVDDQSGVALHLESKTLQGLRPYVIWGLRIITMLMKVSANVGVGLGSMVPNLERSLLKGVASVIPSVTSDVFGQGGTPIEQVNLMKLKNYFNDSEKKIAEQWLVNFLVGRDLQRDFGLQRVRYRDGSNDLAWLCQKHIDKGYRIRILELCPIQVVQ